MNGHDELIRRMDENAERTRAELAALHAEMTRMREDLRGEIAESAAQTREELRGEIRAGDSETRRHMSVLHESLRADIRLIAERLVDMVPRSEFERFRADVREEFGEVRSLIRSSYSDLDRRVRRFESGAGE